MKKKHPKLKKGKWFIKLRGSYLPYSWQGWLTYIPFVAYLLISFGAVFKLTNSVLVMVFLLMPAWVAASVVMTWIAQQKS